MNRPESEIGAAQLPVSVHEDAMTLITAAATAARPRETGGLLLGWWDRGQVAVRHAVEVPDPHATADSWSRDELRAQTALDATLAEHEHPWLGYVGDWHSHPSACSASAQDLESIRRASRQYDQPLVLLIHRSDDVIETIGAHRGRQRQAVPSATTMEGPTHHDHAAAG
jgi:integrative and conjugative element protein (TIGR02256 family)